MKKILTAVLFILLNISFLPGQNLVRNGSFENTAGCIDRFSAIYLNMVPYWYTQFGGLTPDVYNSCDTLPPTVGNANSWRSVCTPKNDFGFQKPNTGYNYAGIFVLGWTNEPPWRTNPWHEIISQKLTQTLDSGVNYSFSMKVSVAEISELFFDGMGVCLTGDSLIIVQNYTYRYISSNLADISWKNMGTLYDTLNWITLSGTFRADGSETFIHISDMDSAKSQSDYVYIDKGYPAFWAPSAYYYIDDVALWRSDDSTYIHSDIGQADTTICYGDSLLLGGNDYPETSYRWQSITHAGQNTDRYAVSHNGIRWVEPGVLPVYFHRKQLYDSGYVWVKPRKTTTYILETTNCIFEKTYDTVVVKVKKCGPNAGLDTAVCKNSTVQIGDSANIGYTCQWTPATNLSSTTAPMPTVTATQSMMYYLTVSNASGVINTDSVYVTAGDCYYSVEVRDDTTICKGDTVYLGKHTYSGVQYEWSPNWLLSSNSIAKPYAKPDTTITYTLKVTDITGNVSYDSIKVTVINCSGNGIGPQKNKTGGVAVYPNPAKDLLNIKLSNPKAKIVKIRIINLLGQSVLEVSGVNSYKTLINTSNLNKGTYLIEVISDNDNYVQKLIIR